MKFRVVNLDCSFLILQTLNVTENVCQYIFMGSLNFTTINACRLMMQHCNLCKYWGDVASDTAAYSRPNSVNSQWQ
jgi:hypothetical protein